MQCTKIRLTKKGAEIVYLNEAKGGKRVTTYTSKEAPLPDLTNAVKAFVPWVMDLCDLPAHHAETLVVTTLSIREPDDDGVRGLTVHFHRLVEKANGRAHIQQTPFLPEAGDNTSENIAVLDDATIELIEAAERAAERYVNGEHGEQLTFDDAGEDDEDEGEETVEEEKPRRKRGRQLEAV